MERETNQLFHNSLLKIVLEDIKSENSEGIEKIVTPNYVHRNNSLLSSIYHSNIQIAFQDNTISQDFLWRTN